MFQILFISLKEFSVTENPPTPAYTVTYIEKFSPKKITAWAYPAEACPPQVKGKTQTLFRASKCAWNRRIRIWAYSIHRDSGYTAAAEEKILNSSGALKGSIAVQTEGRVWYELHNFLLRMCLYTEAVQESLWGYVPCFHSVDYSIYQRQH